MERRLLAHPRRAFGGLLLGACLTYAAYRTGHAILSPTEGMPADDRSLVGRFVAWPGGAWPPLAAGTLILGTLLLPDGRFEGRWRTRLAVVTAWATIAFAALQLLDDHIMDQAGTPNPLGVEIPYPVQDLLEIAVIAVLAVSLGASLISLPVRLVRRRGANE